MQLWVAWHQKSSNQQEAHGPHPLPESQFQSVNTFAQSFDKTINLNKKERKQDVFVKHNAPDNGQFQRRPRSQGQIF